MPIQHVTYAMPNVRNAQRKAIHIVDTKKWYRRNGTEKMFLKEKFLGMRGDVAGCKERTS
jgi:hypothetical protein